MSTREMASEYRMSHWARILRERNASGLSIKEYCRRSGFRENVYFYWQRKLREATCEELAAKNAEADSFKEQGLVPTGWAICETAEGAGKSLAVEVGKYRIIVERDSDLELLAKVCRTLGSTC